MASALVASALVANELSFAFFDFICPAVVAVAAEVGAKQIKGILKSVNIKRLIELPSTSFLSLFLLRAMPFKIYPK